jgi:hypothetical protein
LVPALVLGKAGNAEQQVHDLCESLNQALVKADVPKLNKIFADEFTIIRPNGMGCQQGGRYKGRGKRKDEV